VLKKNALGHKDIIYIIKNSKKEVNLLKKLSFAIENAEMVRENPDSNFALLALDFFASGDNLHDMYVSEETLLRTADTIKNCPLVWKYDEVLDDVYTHDPDEVPCGFVPESSTITSKKLEDGRTMLSAIAYVWKRYTGPLLSFFKRDGGKKPVSVEMSVYKTQPKHDGKTELLDFRYEGITVLGSYVTPAIPMANASVLSFAEEYEEDLEKEFSFSEIIIPNKIRQAVEKGLEIRKEEGGGTSTGVAFARYLTKNKIITPEKVREINNYFSTHKHSKETVDWLLWGGDYAKEWAEKMAERINDELVTFPYKSKADINPALKGITPPISLAQANAIARQADSIGSDKDKNGWAIAISSFRKTHHVENGKWVKNEGSTVKASVEVDVSDLEDWEYWQEIVEEDFAAEDMGKGEAIQVNKSKDAVSNTAWGSVDKTSLMHKVLKASNYKSLVHDVYLVVDSGWEEHPSSGLHYPIMQIVDGKAVYNRSGLASALGRAQGQNETGVVSKLNGLYKKLGLEENNTVKASADDTEESIEEVITMTEEERIAAEKAEADAKAKTEADAKFAAEEAEAKAKEEAEAKAKEEADAKFAAEEAEAKAKEAQMAADEEAKAKAAEEAKKKLEEEKGKKFEFPLEKMQEMFSDDDDEDDVKMAKAEIAKGKEADFGIVMQGMYAKMCKMAKVVEKMAEDNKAYMAENEQLKKFKAELENQQKEFAISETLKDLSASVYLPEDVRAEMRADAEKYTLENIEAWKNACKAKSFDFAIRMPKNQGIIEVGLPFSGATKKKDNLWE
jgi:hypothetical protein